MGVWGQQQGTVSGVCRVGGLGAADLGGAQALSLGDAEVQGPLGVQTCHVPGVACTRCGRCYLSVGHTFTWARKQGGIYTYLAPTDCM